MTPSSSETWLAYRDFAALSKAARTAKFTGFVGDTIITVVFAAQLN